MKRQMKILFVSLGCDKNLVDSEVMLGLLRRDGFELTDDEMKKLDGLRGVTRLATDPDTATF